MDEKLRLFVDQLGRECEEIRFRADSGGGPDLLAASSLLERALFHLRRYLSSPTDSARVVASEGEMLDIEIEEDLLETNRRIAARNRAILAENDIKAIDVMGAIGSGKTSLIAAMVERLKGRARVGMLGGDVATSIDADRVREKGAVTLQINTGKECHLDANLVRRALESVDLGKIDVLFVENVGNLICPSEFDLGCDQRLVVVSVTEGDSMIVKHPMMFIDADVVAINKYDMAEAFGANVGKLESDLRQLNSRAVAVRTSAKLDQGVDDVLSALGLI
jgi:hydrogenase nickel incorporation protein HypB